MRNTRSLRVIFLLFTLVALRSAVAQVVIATVPVGMGPRGMAVNPATNKIYVADFGNGSGNTVTVIDGAANSGGPDVVVGLPWALAVNSVTNKIYVTNSNVNGEVTVIDGATNNISTITVPQYPTDVAINSVTNKIYVSTGDNAVTVIDGVTNGTTTINVGGGPDYGGLAVNPVTNKIYVACGSGMGAFIAVIDGATNSVTPINFFGVPGNMVVNTVTNKIYVTNYPNTVLVVDGETNNITSVNVGSVPEGIAVNTVTNKIYVANQFSSDVTVIDGATNSTTTVAVGGMPVSVAVDSVTNKVYVVNNNLPSSVTVINGATNTTLQITVGNDSVAVAVDSVTNRVYVSNRGDNTVSVIGPIGIASYDSTLSVLKCAFVSRSCDSDSWQLLGKDNMVGGAEPNEPNTVHNSCADGTAGTFHVDESIDRIKVFATTGATLRQGAIVRVSATVWVADTTQDALDLYYATNANNPTWIYITTLVPRAPGSQTLSALYRLGPGHLQAVRANFRKGGAKSPCSTGNYDDHDDLAFAVR